LQEIIKDAGKEGVKASLEIVIDKLKGDEKSRDVGQDVAEQFARSYVKNIEAEVAKRIKKA
jgi:hypothetical protein